MTYVFPAPTLTEPHFIGNHGSGCEFTDELQRKHCQEFRQRVSVRLAALPVVQGGEKSPLKSPLEGLEEKKGDLLILYVILVYLLLFVSLVGVIQ